MTTAAAVVNAFELETFPIIMDEVAVGEVSRKFESRRISRSAVRIAFYKTDLDFCFCRKKVMYKGGGRGLH